VIANVSAHRRANAFAQALEEQAPQDRTAEQSAAATASAASAASTADEQGTLLTLAGALGELPKPELDPDVKVVQRAQMVAAMEAMIADGAGAEGPAPAQRVRKGAHRAGSLRKFRPRSRWSKGLAAGGLTVGVAAGAFSGVAAASSEALPGDSLYGLKRGMEDLKLGLAEDDSDRGELYLGQASTRMQEARRLMERGRTGELDHASLGEIRRALSGMHHDAAEGHRLLSAAFARDGSLGPIQALDSFSTAHRDSWRELRGRLPMQLTDVSDQVTSVFVAIDQEVGPLKSLLPPALGGDGRPRGSAGSSSGPSGSQGTSGRPAPSSSTSSDRRTGSDGKPRPATSQSTSEGLIGGTDDLLNPPRDDSSMPPRGDDGQSGKPPKPDVTLPPLLPGLLPGLGIDGEDDR
jgi:hypothetical protein